MGDGNDHRSQRPGDAQVPGGKTLWPDWDAPIDAPATTTTTRAAVREGREAARRAERGRHARERSHRGRLWPGSWPAAAQITIVALIVVAVLVPVAAVGLQLATNGGRPGWSAAGEPPAADVAPATPAAGSPADEAGAPSNLLANWSFERDLNGWQSVGGAELSRLPSGHTSGSAAAVRAPGGGEAGIMVARAAKQAPAGERYAATVWVRSDTKGTAVAVCVFSTRNGIRTESDHPVKLAKAGRWRRLQVTHKVPPGGGEVGLEVLLTGGGAMVVDEATLTRR